MFNFVISLFLGLLPEVLYFSIYLKYIKNLKIDKNFTKMLFMLSLGYILLIMICRYQILFYVAYIVWSYITLKIIYKSEITDIFMYSVGFAYLMLVAYIFYKLLYSQYVIYYIVDRIFLFVPLFLLKNKLNKFYLYYKSLWNRSNESKKIKSLTLRNISLVFINAMIFILNILVFMALLDYTNL